MLQVKLIPGFSRDWTTKHGGTCPVLGNGSAMAARRRPGHVTGGATALRPWKASATAGRSLLLGSGETMANVDCSANMWEKSSWLKRAKASNSCTNLTLVEGFC